MIPEPRPEDQTHPDGELVEDLDIDEGEAQDVRGGEEEVTITPIRLELS